MSGDRFLANTWTGRVFNPLRPDPAVICIEDIAHSLSGASRYLRHTDKPYSTAQHCVILSHLVAPALALKALLHDGDEAYIGDVIAPLKTQSLMGPYRALSSLWIATIFVKFGLSAEFPDEVHALDVQLRINEVRDLFRVVPDWALAGTPLPLSGRPIVPWSADEAESRFLARFKALQEGA